MNTSVKQNPTQLLELVRRLTVEGLLSLIRWASMNTTDSAAILNKINNLMPINQNVIHQNDDAQSEEYTQILEFAGLTGHDKGYNSFLEMAKIAYYAGQFDAMKGIASNDPSSYIHKFDSDVPIFWFFIELHYGPLYDLISTLLAVYN